MQLSLAALVAVTSEWSEQTTSAKAQRVYFACQFVLHMLNEMALMIFLDTLSLKTWIYRQHLKTRINTVVWSAIATVPVERCAYTCMEGHRMDEAGGPAVKQVLTGRPKMHGLLYILMCGLLLATPSLTCIANTMVRGFSVRYFHILPWLRQAQMFLMLIPTESLLTNGLVEANSRYHLQAKLARLSGLAPRD